MNSSEPLIVRPATGNKAVFVCPQCQKIQTAGLNKFKDTSPPLRLKAKCQCGHVSRIFIELRNIIRKETKLTGYYSNLNPNKRGQQGHMIVTNLSRTGLQFKIGDLELKIKDHQVYASTRDEVNFGHKIQRSIGEIDAGDEIVVRFNLDNAPKTLVERDGVVIWVRKPFIGITFTSVPAFDKDLGFYLMD